ncbi:MAG: response regulator, partial [Myxococcota bacterium]
MPSSARLLVVDDNADNRDMLARRLRKRGYEVHTAPDGDEALHMVEGTEYDLVLLDIMMPGTDGMEVLRRLRTSYAQAELPILMATAKTDSSDVVEALRLGANDYVTKPIDFPVALARIQSHLQTREEAPTVPAPAAALPPDGRAEPGTVLDGRYEVVREIGEGGFAIVFEARQLSTGQLVAVKVLRHHHADDAAGAVERRRFEREMKVIGKLTHPHVVRLIDFGELKARVEAVDGWSEATEPSEATTTQESSGNRRILKRLPYIVMERIDGEPLQALLLRKAPLAIDVTTAIFLPVVSAVAAAHRLG